MIENGAKINYDQAESPLHIASEKGLSFSIQQSVPLEMIRVKRWLAHQIDSHFNQEKSNK